ncbi:MAG TPA: TIGR04282 family arsenosugar biosynthesis glycosyltransferase [Planctomycetota bacterium]|nr:TIGR04282 family arsenosugar biosynthesis glycosyltransferase [Planctomycetota bacterium]
MDSDLQTLLLFSRYPAPGACKSRLAEALGPERAAALARAMLLDLVSRLPQELADIHCVLCFDPPEAMQQFQSLLSEVPQALQRFALLPQRGKGLGERLASALETVRKDRPYTDLVFIGSDAPELTAASINEGFIITRGGRAGILRAQDGGYVLLALPCNAGASVFTNIHWSSQTTADEQVARLRELGSEVVELSGQGWDIDEAADLKPLLNRLKKNPELAPRTLSALSAIGIESTSSQRPHTTSTQRPRRSQRPQRKT